MDISRLILLERTYLDRLTSFYLRLFKKNVGQVAQARHRSGNHLLVNLLASLILYTHQPKQPFPNLHNESLNIFSYSHPMSNSDKNSLKGNILMSIVRNGGRATI